MPNESDSDYVADEIAWKPQRLDPSDDDWWRELQTEIDAETGLREAEICWCAADEQFAFARNLSTLPAESDGQTPDLRRLME